MCNQTETTQHTPTPWKIDKYGIITGGPHFCTSIGAVCQWNLEQEGRAKAGHIVMQGFQGGMVEEAAANIHFIDCACNSHDELLKALQQLTRCAEKRIPITKEKMEVIRAARAAIAKAEGF